MASMHLAVNMENLTTEERNRLMKLVEKAGRKKPEPWSPQQGDEIWYIGVYGDVCRTRWVGSTPQAAMWKYGNVFETKEKAEFMAEKRMFVAKLSRLSEASYRPESENPVSIVSVYDCATEQLGCKIRSYDGVRRCSFKFDNVKDAKAALEEVGEENYLKYMCGKGM